MQKVKFVHCSDLHLDTPFKGLTRRDPVHAERQKRATSASFSRIIDLCINEQVDFLVIAGDVYDSENRSVATQIGFAKQLKRLEANGIPVFMVCGNHDPLSEWIPAAKLPPNVHRFLSGGVQRWPFIKNGERAADIYGTSYDSKSVTENLAATYEIGVDPAPVNIAVLHGTVGSPGPHENYAPFRPDDVTGKGFDYWALGHIHHRHIIRHSDPAIVYPGNPQGRDFGETGAKGCMLVEIAPGDRPSIRFRATQTIRFEEVEIDLTGEDDLERLGSLPEEISSLVPDHDPGCSYVYRVRLTGRTPLHGHLAREGEIESLIADLNDETSGERFSVIDRIELATSPDLDLDAIREANDFPASVLKLSDRCARDYAELYDLFEEVDAEFKSGAARRELTEITDERRKEILRQSTLMLLGHLAEDSE